MPFTSLYSLASKFHNFDPKYENVRSPYVVVLRCSKHVHVLFLHLSFHHLVQTVTGLIEWLCQFMVLSSDPLEQQKIEIENDITLLSESRVKLLGVIIDDRLQFNDHISAMCCRAARQLNALARISKHLDSKSKHIIYNSFVASNFNYCPLVWHFCGQVNNNKLEKLQERSLRIIHNDYEASFETLLKCSKQESLLTKRLKIMILEVFKTVNRLNPSCLHDLFTWPDQSCLWFENPEIRTTKTKDNHIWASNIFVFGIKIMELACQRI